MGWGGICGCGGHWWQWDTGLLFRC
jgi:hypothetical protein